MHADARRSEEESAGTPPVLRDEIRGMADEPMLRAEKVMIAVSLSLGVLLLIVFVLVSRIL